MERRLPACIMGRSLPGCREDACAPYERRDAVKADVVRTSRPRSVCPSGCLCGRDARTTELANSQNLIQQKKRTDQEMYEIAGECRRTLFVYRMADALENPAHNQGDHSDTQIRDLPGGKINRTHNEQHSDG